MPYSKRGYEKAVLDYPFQYKVFIVGGVQCSILLCSGSILIESMDSQFTIEVCFIAESFFPVVISV